MSNILGRRRDGRPIFTIAGGAPTPLEVMEGRLSELRSTIDNLFEQRGKLIDTAAAESRGFTPAEQTTYDELGGKRDQAEKDLAPVQARVEELRTEAKRENNANETRRIAGDSGEQSGNAPTLQVTEPDIYLRDGANGNSWFRDAARAKVFDDFDAADRIRRSAKVTRETRALGNTGAVGGSGGEFAPPQWLVAEWVELIRPGRVTADLFAKEDVPVGVSSINYPKIATGTTTAVQSTQNTALSQTDLTTTFVQTGFATIGGKQVVSQQLLDQSAINFDQVILKDLAADYGQRVGTQVLLGAGTGSGTGATVNGLGAATAGSTQTWTQASPTPSGFYGQAGALLAAFLGKRLMPPTCWLMSPRRWYWLASSVDANGRPLVVPNGAAFNPMGTQSNAVAPFGNVGTFHGLPVYIDPLIPTNLGTGTNQDTVYLLKTDDLVLFESAPQVEMFRETYADSVGVLFRMYAYVGTVLNRHPESIGVLSGTGLVTPVFGS